MPSPAHAWGVRGDPRALVLERLRRQGSEDGGAVVSERWRKRRMLYGASFARDTVLVGAGFGRWEATPKGWAWRQRRDEMLMCWRPHGEETQCSWRVGRGAALRLARAWGRW
eukprot:7380241-Prymnesium_polylepis.1